ncbi:hypothetical protein AVEN_191147-1 [Araneus ventricosus]|uniref:Uncharacterized protein n=1 Tax=Araneus ventricosus TaxID=182803 RepID=A0A4Y2AZS2_ARAVE|nr:hypothetical protein AVEN_191147-1 [Araneus ventricosus]
MQKENDISSILKGWCGSEDFRGRYAGLDIVVTIWPWFKITSCVRPVFPRASSAVRVILCPWNRKRRGLVSASVASRVMAVNRSHVKGGGNGQTASVHPFAPALPRDLPSHAPSERRDWLELKPTTVYKYELRVTRGFIKPHAMGTRLSKILPNSK